MAEVFLCNFNVSQIEIIFLKTKYTGSLNPTQQKQFWLRHWCAYSNKVLPSATGPLGAVQFKLEHTVSMDNSIKKDASFAMDIGAWESERELIHTIHEWDVDRTVSAHHSPAYWRLLSEIPRLRRVYNTRNWNCIAVKYTFLLSVCARYNIRTLPHTSCGMVLQYCANRDRDTHTHTHPLHRTLSSSSSTSLRRRVHALPSLCWGGYVCVFALGRDGWVYVECCLRWARQRDDDGRLDLWTTLRGIAITHSLT